MGIRKVEVFTAGCQVCEPTVELVRKVACDNCEVIIYDLNKGCDSNICRERAEEYGVKRLPAVAVDGKLLNCCASAMISEKELRAVGIGR